MGVAVGVFDWARVGVGVRVGFRVGVSLDAGVRDLTGVRVLVGGKVGMGVVLVKDCPCCRGSAGRVSPSFLEGAVRKLGFVRLLTETKRTKILKVRPVAKRK